MARRQSISQPTVSRIVAQHRTIVSLWFVVCFRGVPEGDIGRRRGGDAETSLGAHAYI